MLMFVEGMEYLVRLIGRLERKEGYRYPSEGLGFGGRWRWGWSMDWYGLVCYSSPQGGRRCIKHRVMGVRWYSFVLLAWCLELTAYFVYGQLSWV